METTFRPRLLAILLLAGAALQGCQKEIDFIRKHGPGPLDVPLCNIRQISVFAPGEAASDTITYTFTYNALGDPTSVRNTLVSTGNPNMVFKYDAKCRLTEMIRPYSNGLYETWTKYYYNLQNQVAVDTQYIFGTYTDSVPVAFPQYGYRVSWYSYDGFDRVTGRIDTFYGPGMAPYGTSTAFAYDASGNLVTGGVYDSRLSILRTSKVWMFICCNYSINNAFQAVSYNALGLPLVFQGSYSTMEPIIPQSGQFVVDYWCH